MLKVWAAIVKEGGIFFLCFARHPMTSLCGGFVLFLTSFPTKFQTCDYDNYAGGGSLADLYGASITLSAEFLQECSYVEWSSRLHIEKSFVVNMKTRDEGDADGRNKNMLELTLFNKEGLERQWADNPRLLEVRLQYRPVGTYAWQWGLNKTGGILDVRGKETPYGTGGVGERERKRRRVIMMGVLNVVLERPWYPFSASPSRLPP